MRSASETMDLIRFYGQVNYVVFRSLSSSVESLQAVGGGRLSSCRSAVGAPQRPRLLPHGFIWSSLLPPAPHPEIPDLTPRPEQPPRANAPHTLRIPKGPADTQPKT